MIRDTFRVARNGLPILRDKEIDRIAEHILIDYDPLLLEVPQPIPIELIMESYFDLMIDYQYLSNNGYKLGSIIFRDNTVQYIYNPTTNEAEEYFADRGTVLIDARLTDPESDCQMRITEAHETGHWFFHRIYFSRLAGDDAAAARIIDCRDSIVEWGTKRLVTDRDWMEHHANYFSGAILMPESAFRKAAAGPDIQHHLLTWYPLSCEAKRNEVAARMLSYTFAVSKQAALIRMKNLGITMGEMSWEEFVAAKEQEIAKHKKSRRKRRKKNDAARV